MVGAASAVATTLFAFLTIVYSVTVRTDGLALLFFILMLAAAVPGLWNSKLHTQSKREKK